MYFLPLLLFVLLVSHSFLAACAENFSENESRLPRHGAFRFSGTLYFLCDCIRKNRTENLGYCFCTWCVNCFTWLSVTKRQQLFGARTLRARRPDLPRFAAFPQRLGRLEQHEGTGGSCLVFRSHWSGLKAYLYRDHPRQRSLSPLSYLDVQTHAGCQEAHV